VKISWGGDGKVGMENIQFVLWTNAALYELLMIVRPGYFRHLHPCRSTAQERVPSLSHSQPSLTVRQYVLLSQELVCVAVYCYHDKLMTSLPI
jgi:hypothetical protein